MTNLNKLAIAVTKGEGLKESIDIAQVKEVMRVLFTEMGKLTRKEQHEIIDRYAKKQSVRSKSTRANNQKAQGNR